MDERFNTEKIPDGFRNDIQTAVDILGKEGCKEIYLFGSLVQGDFSAQSDIDLAVTGLKKKNFFKTLGLLLSALEHSVDLVNLEKGDRFSAMLLKKGNLVRVG